MAGRMFTANLYLPESLYPKQPPMSDHAVEAQNSGQKYFEHKSKDRKPQEPKPLDSRSTATSRRSPEDVTNVFSSLTSVFNFAEFATSLGKVSSENEVFVNLIQRVRHDVTEASRLYTSHPVTEYLGAWPDKKTWIDAILLDVQRALNDIGVYVEGVRVAGDDGGAVGLKRKFEWVLSHHKKLISRELNLTLCHQSLMAAIQIMQTAEMGGHLGGHDPIFEAPARPWLPEENREILRSPYSRQKWRLSQRNLSLPSITVSEAVGNELKVNSVNSFPAELPGSTPQDLPDPNNLDLYAPPLRSDVSSPVSAQSSAEQSHPQTSSREEPLPWSDEEPKKPPEKEESSYLAKLQFPPASNQITLRRSFDQPRPRASRYNPRPRVSLDQVRPRAYSDQGRPRSSFDSRSPGSLDQVWTLPTLDERSVDRNDSTSSTGSFTKLDSVPVIAKSYRPKAIHIGKPPMAKHHSLPSELPLLKSQPSLIAELSEWVLPSVARESYHSTDTSGSFEVSTPATSITSSPVIPNSPASCPEMFHPTASLASLSTPNIAPLSDSAPPTQTLPQTKFPTPSMPQRPDPSVSMQESLTIASSDAFPIQTPKPNREPLPSEEDSLLLLPRLLPQTNEQVDVTANEEDPTSFPPSPHQNPPLESQGGASTISAAPNSNERSSDALEPSSTTPPQNTPSSDFSPSSNARATPEFHSQSASTENLAPAPAPTPAPIRAPPNIPANRPPIPKGIDSLSNPTKSLPTNDPSKAMNSQAKRRAAHARRMRIAYETED